MSTEDIDEIVIDRSVRPSLFLTPLQYLGTAVGVVTRVSRGVGGGVIEDIVDAASRTQLNDCIRDLGGDALDVKETIKFHRDVFAEESAVEKDTNSKKCDTTGPAILLSNLLRTVSRV